MAIKILEITMASYNRVVIVGNLTRDVELRYTPSGTAVTDIALAVNDRIKKNDQWVDEVNFFDVTFFLLPRLFSLYAVYLTLLNLLPAKNTTPISSI